VMRSKKPRNPERRPEIFCPSLAVSDRCHTHGGGQHAQPATHPPRDRAALGSDSCRTPKTMLREYPFAALILR
jgi:hypothetical protein